MGARIVRLSACLLASLPAFPVHGQITPSEASQIQSVIGNRIEALTLLGGDYGIAGGTFRTTGRLVSGGRTNTTLGTSKLGGAGDIGDPQPLGDLGVGWQPRLMGNLGFIKSTNDLDAPLLQNDVNTFKGYGIEFGGGARFWLSDGFSLAPTLMLLYGHTQNDYIARSPFMQANLARATTAGLVGYDIDTWTLRPALNVQYVLTLERVLITLSSEPVYFRTQTLHRSNINVDVNGSSGSLDNKIDIDAPLALELFGHELRGGGYFSRTDLFGDLKAGLDVNHLYEVHGRLVLDVLNSLWKVQWVGVGASYVWGDSMRGFTAGLDVSFRF